MKNNTKKNRFQMLCVTMAQKDFSILEQMNVRSDIVIANQDGRSSYDEYDIREHHAIMVTTNTIGVGNNRNIGLMYANADICLLADDDINYIDDLEKVILEEFDSNPDADVIIFNVNSNSAERPEKVNKHTRKVHKFERMPYGAVRIAFRLSAIKKSNIWFNTLFGGGCIFSAGEDSLFIREIRKKGLALYVSNKTICSVNYEESSWFNGYNKEYFYGKGAYCTAAYPKMRRMWMMYYAIRTKSFGSMKLKEKMIWMKKGEEGYCNMHSYK